MKKLVVLSMLVLTAFLAACGGGVATVSPPAQAQDYQAAHLPTVEVPLEAATEPGELQGGEVATTEPTLPPTTEAAPTELATETEIATEVPTEIMTEEATPTEVVTEVTATPEIPTQQPTLPPTEPSTAEPTIEPTLAPSEVPTEEGGAGGLGDQTATLPPTETAVPSATATDTATLVPTDTPAPTDTDTPVPTNTATASPTDTPRPTDTATATATETLTPVPTNTATASPTDTPVPTDTATATATETLTPVPTDTASPSPTATFTMTMTPTFTPSFTLTFTATFTHTPSATYTPTETYTPTLTFTPTATLIPSDTPTPTNTPFVPPQEFTTYASEDLHLSLDYPAEWAEPVFDEPFLLISPDGSSETFPVAAITRGSPDYFASELGVDEVSSPQAFLEAVAQSEADSEVSKVSGYPYPTFALITSSDDIKVRGLLFVVNDQDWIFLIGAADPETFDLYSEATFQQMAVSIVAESIEPTETPTHIPTNTPRPTATLPPTLTPTATPVPILGETYQDEDAGFAFDYPEGAEVSEGENSVTVAAEVENIPGEVYFVRGRPEALAEQGIICESRDPVEALRCVNPDVEPTFTDRYAKFGSPAWFTVQNVETDGQVNAVVSYVVAAGPEWIFIRLTAPASDYTTANLQLFQPILDSVLIEVQPVDIFGRWGLR